MSLIKKPERSPLTVEVLIEEAQRSLNTRPLGEVNVVGCARATAKSCLAAAMLLREIADMMRTAQRRPE